MTYPLILFYLFLVGILIFSSSANLLTDIKQLESRLIKSGGRSCFVVKGGVRYPIENVGTIAGAAATLTVIEVWVKGVPALDISYVTVYVPGFA